jgi:hypothetical protein
LNYLMGMMLHYDGNATKAEEYFRKAVELPGRHRPYAAMYLPDAPPAAPVPAAVPVPAVQVPLAVPQVVAPQEVKPAGAKPPVPRPVN